MNWRYLLLCLSLAACNRLWAAHLAPDFAGSWNVVVHFADGTASAVLALEAHDGQYRGTSGPLDEAGTFALAYEGAVQDGRLKLTLAAAPPGSLLFPQPIGAMTLEIKNGALAGSGTLYRVPITLSGTRPDDRPTLPKTYDYAPTRYSTRLSGATPPVLRIHSGDTVRTTTLDANGQDEHGQWAWMPGNTQTGPFYVEGAAPGDTLVVHLNRVRVNQARAEMACWALAPNALTPGYPQRPPGSPCGFYWALDAEQGTGRLEQPSAPLKNFIVKLHPMIGTIGVAPPSNQAIPASDLGNYGGNLDYNHIGEGTTLYLPVYRAGALLTLGDAHALQGDGEITGQGLETTMAVEFRVELIKGKSLGRPWAEDDEFIMVSGIGNSLTDALQAATSGLVDWLQDRYRLEQADIATILGTSIHYEIAEIVDPRPHVVAKLRKELLAQIEKP